MNGYANYFRAGYPVLYLHTAEENRVEHLLLQVATELKRNIVVWSHTDGFFESNCKFSNKDMQSPIEALEFIKDAEKTAEHNLSGGNGDKKYKTIYIFKDLHKFFDDVRVLRLIRDISKEFKQRGDALVIIAPTNKLNPDIERDVTLIDFKLPERAEIHKLWDKLYTNSIKPKLPKDQALGEDEQEAIVDAGMGLTCLEAENAFAKAVIDWKGISETNKSSISKLVLREKAQVIKKSGILEYYDTNQTAADVGGLENLKEFLKERGRAFSKKAQQMGLPKPRGIVLCGLPGTGKSLISKVASNILNVPLIRFDIGRVFAGLVGQSEANCRLATDTIDAVGCCVAWIDEMEKAFAGGGSGGSNDSGVTDRVVGHILTWAQEKTSPSFIIATVNRIDNILRSMPELLRKGRFDDIFFVGLPSAAERKEILKIHVRKAMERRDSSMRKDLDSLKIDYDELVEKSSGFSGAELAEAVITGQYKAFYRDMELNTDHILYGILNTVPLSKSAEDQLKAMSKWAELNATPASKYVKGDKLVEGTPKFEGNRNLEI